MVKQVFLVMFELMTTTNPNAVERGQLKFHNRAMQVQEWFIDYAQVLDKDGSGLIFTPEWRRCEAFKREMERPERRTPAIFECVSREIGE